MRTALLLGLTAGALLALPALAGRQDPLTGDPRVEALGADPRELPSAPPERWLEWRPNDPIPEAFQAPMERAVQAYLAGDHPTALALFLDLLRREPDHPPSLYQAAVVYFRLRRYGDARVLFERFLRAAPGEVGATQALGHCLYSLGDYGAALAHYERVLAAAPDSVEARRGLGLTRMRLGDWEGALADLERVVELRPGHADAHAWRATVLRELDRLDEALSAAERARDLDPFEPKPWFLLAQLLGDLGREGQADEARERFQQLDRIAQDVRAEEGRILADPYDLSAHARLVALHRSGGHLGAVRAALERLARLSPDDPRVAMLALETFRAMGDEGGARLAAEELERTGASSIEALRMLEGYYAVTGELQKRLRAGERWRRLEAERDGR